MALGWVLDPTGEVPEAETGTSPLAAPAVGSLRGRVVGVRRDRAWQSWDWVSDEWATALEAAGATVVFHRADTFVGKEAELADAALSEFLDDLDAAVIGLCNCGSCTLYTVRAAAQAARRGMPTVVVTTEHFEGLARTLARLEGHPDLPLVVLPFPLETRPEDEVRDIGRGHADAVFVALGAER